jgi:hypothetical protein
MSIGVPVMHEIIFIDKLLRTIILIYTTTTDKKDRLLVAGYLRAAAQWSEMYI